MRHVLEPLKCKKALPCHDTPGSSLPLLFFLQSAVPRRFSSSQPEPPKSISTSISQFPFLPRPPLPQPLSSLTHTQRQRLASLRSTPRLRSQLRHQLRPADNLPRPRMRVASVHVGFQLGRVQQAWVCLAQLRDANHLHCGFKLVLEDCRGRFC